MEKFQRRLYVLAAVPAILMILSWATGSNNMILREGVAFTCAAICILIVLAISNSSRVLWILSVAFFLAIIGDYFLHKQTNDTEFITGILFFFLSHICFLVYALKRAKFHWMVFVLIAIPLLVFYFVGLVPSAGLRGDIPLTVAALCYLLVSSFSLAAAVSGVVRTPKSSARWAFTLGIASLLISDTFISIVDFIKFTVVDPLVMPLYYLAHVLVALSVTLEYAGNAGNGITTNENTN